jgi:hypothetical protein
VALASFGGASAMQDGLSVVGALGVTRIRVIRIGNQDTLAENLFVEFQKTAEAF